jgi:hypothetical protein
VTEKVDSAAHGLLAVPEPPARLSATRTSSYNLLSSRSDAADIYYRDIIGNISTSHVRRPKPAGSSTGAVEMEIEPRFPLFGGWKTQWYQGYNVPAQHFLATNADGSYTLTFDANVPYAEVSVRPFGSACIYIGDCPPGRLPCHDLPTRAYLAHGLPKSALPVASTTATCSSPSTTTPCVWCCPRALPS